MWGAVLLFAAILTCWSVLTPAYRAPDEPQHVSAVVGLVEGQGWPRPGEAVMDQGVLASQTLIGYTVTADQRGFRGGGNTLPGVRSGSADQPPLYSVQEPTPAGERTPYDELRAAGLDAQLPNQMTQHPPGYYAVVAAALSFAGDWRFDRQLALLRLLGVAMVMWLPLLAFLTTRMLTGSATLGSAAAFVPLAIPQLAHIGASVNNDALVILLGGVLVTLLAWVLTGGRSLLLLGSIAVVLGLALLSKGSMLAAIPATAAAVVVGLHRSRPAGPSRPWLWAGVKGVLVLSGAFAVGGWWWALNQLRYGTLQPNAYGESPLRDEPLSLLGFTAGFVERLSLSFWGNFGWLELPLDQAVTTVLSVVVAPVALAAFADGRTRAPLLVLSVFPVVGVLALFASVYAVHQRNGQFPGMQGRYLFGALVIGTAAVAIGLGVLARRVGLDQRWLVPLTAVVAVVVAGYGAVVAFSGFYLDVGVGVGAAWDFMSAWSPWPGWLVDTLAAATVAIAAAVLTYTVAAAARTRSAAWRHAS
ncbi:hypothetical protein BH20ACT5_BH20ACT5_17260 [soil metagenome]